MTRSYLPYQQRPVQHPGAPNQPKPLPPWWRPLTRWWGIFGVIIFMGLVMWLIEHSHFHRPKPPVPVERAKPALRVERSSSHFATVAPRTAS